ncbi:MAG: hypothetical protein ACYCOS_02925 [Sulfobacillus sp.]
MSAALVPIAVGFVAMAVAVLVILNLSLAAGARTVPEAAGDKAAETQEQPPVADDQQLERQESDQESELELPSFQDLDALRRLPGVRGVALWGVHGAVLRAEGELLETILPEAARVLETLRQAGGAVGSGPWMSFKVEGLTGSMYGARMHGVSLVVVTDPSAEASQIERQLYQTTLHAPAELAQTDARPAPDDLDDPTEMDASP